EAILEVGPQDFRGATVLARVAEHAERYRITVAWGIRPLRRLGQNRRRVANGTGDAIGGQLVGAIKQIGDGGYGARIGRNGSGLDALPDLCIRQLAMASRPGKQRIAGRRRWSWLHPQSGNV